MANRTNFSEEFREQKFKPDGDKARSAQVIFRVDQDLKDAIKKNADNPSQWYRRVIERAAVEAGWIDEEGG